MVPRRMRQGNPTQEIAHSSIFGPLEHEVPMIRHQLIRKNAAWIADKPFGKNILKRFVVAFLVENDRSSIATVQGMVDRILLVGAFRAGHPNSSTTPNLAVKSPDPLSSRPLVFPTSYLHAEKKLKIYERERSRSSSLRGRWILVRKNAKFPWTTPFNPDTFSFAC